MPTNHISFPVKENDKVPAVLGWEKLTKSIPTKNAKQNKGLLTGKRAGFIVFDLDHYKNNDIVKYKENPIFKELGKDIIEKLSNITYTVKTPSGGYHFYFNYNEKFPRTRHSKKENPANFDLLSTGGFIMSPPSKINNIRYEAINNKPICEMPEYLTDYLLKNLDFETENNQNISSDDMLFLITPKELKSILSKVNKSFCVDYNKWLCISTCVKKICEDKKNQDEYIKVWDEWCKTAPNYNYKKNMASFKCLKADKIDISYLFNATGKKVKPFGFVKTFKDLDNIKPDYEVDKQKLGYDFINEINQKFNSNKYLIKSDTGTGKTTSFNHYVKETKQKFISLVTRQLLGKEQQINLKKLNIESKFYIDDNYDYGDNIIICADSLLNLDDFDFSDYVIFIDEFNSVIEYILNSTTFIKNHRRTIINIIKNMIEKSKLFIGVDADISLLSFSFLRKITNFKYIVNNKKFFEGVEYVIYKNQEDFIKSLKNEDKFLLCSDSATVIENLNVNIDFHKIIGKNKDNIVNDEEQETLEEFNKKNKFEFIDLDSKDKIGFSPKIVYGQDSTMNRPVYAWFKCHTITPPQMIQQIARCRNPTKIHIIVEKTTSSYPLYNSLEDVKNDINNSIQIYKSEYKDEEEMNNDIYYNSLISLLYKNDCYNTNKYLFLSGLLTKRGFKFSGFIGNDEKHKFKNEKEAVDKEYKSKFLEHIKQQELPNYIKNINSILQIPKENLKDYSEFFTDDFLLKQHLTFNKIFNNDIDKNKYIKKIQDSNEFMYNKLKTNENKILFTQKIMNILNLSFDNITIGTFKNINKYNHAELEKEYKAISKTSKTKLNFNKPTEIYKAMGSILRNLLGDCIKSKRINIDGTKNYVYEYNKDIFNKHMELININITNNNKQEINYEDIDFIDE